MHYCSFGFCVFRLCCLLRGAVCVAIIPDLGLVGFNGGCFCGCGVGFGDFWCCGFLVGLVECLCFDFAVGLMQYSLLLLCVGVWLSGLGGFWVGWVLVCE